MNIFGTKEKIAVIFDIGSASVGGALVSLAPGTKPKIIAAVREEMVFQEDLKFDRLVSSMQDALSRAARSLQKTPLPFFSDRLFFCSFSSPWYASQTRTVSVRAEKPFSVTRGFIEDAAQKEADDFLSLEAARFSTGVLAEKEILQVKVNGYETRNPIGKKARQAEVAVYASVLPEKIAALVRGTIGSSFHFSRVSFHSFPFLASGVIRGIFHESDFLFIDISGEITDVSLVRGGVLQETASFPCGKNFIIRTLMRELSFSHAESLSAISLSQEEKHEEKAAAKTARALSSAGKEWSGEFRGALASLSRAQKWIPARVFFMADDEVLPWFSERISEESPFPDGGAGGGEEKHFQTKAVSAAFLAESAAFAPGISPDSFLAILAAFLKMRMKGERAGNF